MNCTFCRMQLPEHTKVCPNCGTPTPLYYSGTGSSPTDATIASSYNPRATGLPPQTVYGSNPYEVTAPPPPPPPLQYPYNAAPPSLPPTQPSGGGNRKRLGLMVGIGVLVVVLILAGVFTLLRPGSTAQNPTPTVNGTVQATATPNTSQNPYSPHTGTLVLSDPLKDNSKGYKWDESTTGSDACGFSGGAYHIVEKTGLICIAEAPQLTLSNFAFEADITIVAGDNGGIAFRIDQVHRTFYSLDIGTNGGYVLQVYTDKYRTLSQGTNAVINKGLNQTNLLAVVANGDLITIYVNNQILDSVHDSTYTQGQLGVLSFANNGLTDNVIASNVRVWKL